MNFIEKFLLKYFPTVYRSNDALFGVRDYVVLEDYKEDIIRVNTELKSVEDTINYYKDRRKVLLEWKDCLESRVGKWDEESECVNCDFFNNGFCSKFSMNVDNHATCDCFVWRKNKIK